MSVPIRLEESVLFLDESGDFWTNLEWMHRCTNEALAHPQLTVSNE